MKSKFTDSTGELPKKFLTEKEYAPLEKAYFKRMASKKVFYEYKGKNDSIKSKIDAYVAAQTEYYQESTNGVDTDAQKEVVKNKLTAANKAFEAIAVKDDVELNKTNRALIDQYVKDKQEEIKLFDKLAPDVTGTATTNEEKCKEANRRALGEYLERSLAASKAAEAVKKQEVVVANFQKKVDA
jgi:hypothetical protein